MYRYLRTPFVSWRGYIILTLERTRSAVAENAERRFEENRQFEEISDIAERIGYAIDIPIHYELRGDHLFALTDTKNRPMIEQTAQAKRAGEYAFTGNDRFEYTRLCHEDDEALMADDFARGLLGGNVMIKASKVPDAVVDGTTSIQGYRRDLLRSFIRVYYRDGPNVACRLFSLDHNNIEGFSRVGALLGIPMDNRSSEDILADHTLIDVPSGELLSFVDGLVASTKAEYDAAVWETTQHVTHAGSYIKSHAGAHELVRGSRLLVSQHMQAIRAIQSLALDTSAKEQLFEIERRRTAAAIKLQLQGHAVTSNSDTSVSAEVESNDYGRECATANNGMNQSEAELMKDWKKIVESCPLCGAKKVVAEKTGDVIRGIDCGCELNVCTGNKKIRGLKKDNGQHDQTVNKTISNEAIIKDGSKERIIRMKYGEHAILMSKLTIGGKNEYIVDKNKGSIIDRSPTFSKSDFALAV